VATKPEGIYQLSGLTEWENWHPERSKQQAATKDFIMQEQQQHRLLPFVQLA
jgi:hypothetical protein